MKRPGQKGSLLLEASAVVTLLAVTLVLLIEVSRRGLVILSIEHASFLASRERALGMSEGQVRERTQALLRRAIPLPTSQFSYKENSVSRVSDLSRLKLGDHAGGMVTVSFRYPQFLSQRINGRNKTHQEASARCLYPLSSY